MLTIPDLTLLFMVVVSSLAVALIYMLHQLEPKLARLRLRVDRARRDASVKSAMLHAGVSISSSRPRRCFAPYFFSHACI
ncbi:hypothetical protein WDM22_27700 [Bradyrhizobium septentrionale]|uniref:hypothetical protein n=1 Tax=Bradyrhizobium septentrionale TaxID=1404411 RepID=UPI0030D0BA75